MVLLGLGTLPMMLGISLLGNMAGVAIRNKINKVIPFVVVFVGIWFIMSGLNLGIPFVSPKRDMIEKKFEKELQKQELGEAFDVSSAKEAPCCKKIHKGE